MFEAMMEVVQELGASLNTQQMRKLFRNFKQDVRWIGKEAALANLREAIVTAD